MGILGNLKKEINRRHAVRQEEKRVYNEIFQKEKIRGMKKRAAKEGYAVGLGERKFGSGNAIGAAHGFMASWGNKMLEDQRREKAAKPVKAQTYIPTSNDLLFGRQAPPKGVGIKPIVMSRKKKRRSSGKTVIIKL